MNLNFHYVAFKNILSYGNKLTRIDFDKGLTLISATNGSGKSSILDALNYCLYGKAYRDIKIDQLINRVNKKQMFCEIEFELNNKVYKVQRGKKPDIFKIYEDGVEIDMLSTKKNNQEYLNNLMHIGDNLFRMIICISSGDKPFLAKTAAEKRKQLEEMFSLNVLGNITSDLKKEKVILNSDYKSSTNDYNSQKGLAESYRNQKAIITEQNSKLETINAENIKSIEDRIVAKKEEIAKLERNIKKCEDELEKHTITTTSEELKEKLIKAKVEIEGIKKNIDTLGDKCPICGNTDVTHIQHHKDELNKELSEIIEKAKSWKEEYISVNQEEEFINTLKNNIAQFNTDKSYKDNELSSINVEKENFKPIDLLDCSEVDMSLKDTIENIDKIYNNLTNLEKELKINGDLIEILSDNGIKRHFFNKLIPLLNQDIAKYLEEFGLNIKITVEDNFDTIITDYRNEIAYEAFSCGERTRIDLAMLLSMYNICIKLSSLKCNLLFIDELLDTGIDDNGLMAFMGTICRITKENKLSSYIISHKLQKTPMINNVLKIEKNNMFSEITKV
ncbi:MAG: AAA family ATPase [Paludibacteraceae bacterium]|nr:AAA family ATPase [Paludibacteraceae bacterium]